MQDDAYEEFECDEDPTQSPEEIKDAYKKLKEDDDSVKTHQNPYKVPRCKIYCILTSQL